MSPVAQTELPDCTDRCRSTQHGDIITAAISRRSVTDFDLCSFLNYTCSACESVRDSAGRTALHVAASCGRLKLVRWLVQNRHANINAKDEESGFTPLHRSIFYGKINITIELMKLGANIALLDSNNLTMLDHALKDGFEPNCACGELYVWGSNCNNSLGPQQARSTPELMDVFHRKYPSEQVSKVLIDKFHSIILTAQGNVYSCGHGQGGRLGLGTQQTIVIPEVVKLPQNSPDVTCIDVAISKDHSIFLLSDGTVYACGLNVHRVLGLSPPLPQALTPTIIKKFSNEIRGVCTGQFHSVVWGPHALYTWGLNAGQLGHKFSTDEKYIVHPKPVKLLNVVDTIIKTVDCSDGAISVCTEKGDIYVLHEYQCRKIASRQLNVIQVCIFGGALDSSLSKEISADPRRELKVAALTNTGNVLLWQESDPQLCRCIFSLNRAVIVKQMTINAGGLLLVTKEGEAFEGFIRPRKKKIVVNSNEKNAFHKFLEREDCITIKLAKLSRIYRAINIQSDTKGNDFCVIQAPPYKYFDAPEVIDSDMSRQMGNLLAECEENDSVHDITFKIGDRYFSAHRYIVSFKSPYLEQLLMHSLDVMTLNDFEPLIFEQFLLYSYTGTCDLLKCGPCPERLRNLCDDVDHSMTDCDPDKRRRSKSKSKNPVRMFHEMAKKLGCVDLCNVLSNLDMQKCIIKNKTGKDVRLKPLAFDNFELIDFCDVSIRCSDGQEVRAHKCILAARADYFSSLFSMRWHGDETAAVTLPCTKSIAAALLEYLYTDNLNILNNKEQDHLFKLLILADQLFIDRLKEQCEYLLYHCLTLKNAVQFLVFSHVYNAHKLKYCCLKFITSNMAPLLEMRCFDNVDEMLLDELTAFYFENKSEICCRVITPYSTAPAEEIIVSVSSAYPVSMDQEVERTAQKTNQKRRSRHRVSSSNDNGTISTEEPISSIKDDLIESVINREAASQVDMTILNRLKAIRLAEEKLAAEDYAPQFEQFPMLTATSSSQSKSSHNNNKTDLKHRIVKISQKQRKRLSSENSNNEQDVLITKTHKNPWKVVSQPSIDDNCNVDHIISSEKKQRENLVKIKSKLLIYTQIEDKAIDELGKFYNADNIMEEMIVVERIDLGAVASPVWVPGLKKLD